MTTTKYDLLICGLGSIGVRHLDIAQPLGFKRVLVVSDRIGFARPGVETISRQAFSQKEIKVEYGIVSSVISSHLSDLSLIRPACTHILVEKPLVRPSDLGPLMDISLDNLVVGYCMRFHAVTKKLRHLIDQNGGSSCMSSIAFSNYSNLRDWRDSDYGGISSSIASEAGGNIYRELSHDFDLAQYLVGGDWSDIRLKATQSGSFGVPAVVSANIAAKLRAVDVTFELSLESVSARKTVELLFNDGTSIEADFLSGLVSVESPQCFEAVYSTNSKEGDLFEMYRDQLSLFFKCAKNTDVRPCSWQEAAKTVEFISKLESL